MTSSSTPERDLALLDRYLARACSVDEAAQVRDRLATDARFKVVHDTLLATVRPEQAERSAWQDDDAAWERLRLDMDEAHGLHRDIVRTSSRTPLRLRWPNRALGEARGASTLRSPHALFRRGIATVVAATAAVGIVFALAQHKPAAPTFARSYHTNVGEVATFTLNDGAQVTLAPGTTLRVADGYGTRSRLIAVDGEAYVNVTRASGIPFIVQTGVIQTQVLGTQFVVRRYGTRASAHVSVINGKVAVAAQTPQRPNVVLTAGQTGDVTDSSAVVSSTGDANADAAWVNGRLIFRDAPAHDVFTALTRWYGYEFRFTGTTATEVAERNWTIALSTRSAHEALATMRIVFGVDLSIDGNVITLRPQQGPGALDNGRRRTREAITKELTHYDKEIGR